MLNDIIEQIGKQENFNIVPGMISEFHQELEIQKGTLFADGFMLRTPYGYYRSLGRTKRYDAIYLKYHFATPKYLADALQEALSTFEST